MKSVKITLFTAAAAPFLSFGANAQTVAKKTPVTKQKVENTAATEAPKNMTPSAITWKEDTHYFGDIEKAKPVSYEFAFKNTTSQTILITNVKASCGCTATNYTKTPIKPGETGTVTATYNAARPGSFAKQITVTTNDSDVNKILHIKGKVIAPEGEENTPTGHI